MKKYNSPATNATNVVVSSRSLHLHSSMWWLGAVYTSKEMSRDQAVKLYALPQASLEVQVLEHAKEQQWQLLMHIYTYMYIYIYICTCGRLPPRCTFTGVSQPYFLRI